MPSKLILKVTSYAEVEIPSHIKLRSEGFEASGSPWYWYVRYDTLCYNDADGVEQEYKLDLEYGDGDFKYPEFGGLEELDEEDSSDKESDEDEDEKDALRKECGQPENKDEESDEENNL